MHEPLDPIGAAQHRVRDHLRAEHVGLEEVVVVEDGPRHVRLGREMHDDVRAAHQVLDERGVAHVAVPELDAAARVGRLEVGRQVVDAAGVGQQVEHQDPVVRILVEDVVHEVAADESGAAGHEKCFHWVCSLFRIDALSSPQLSSRSMADRYGTNGSYCCG